MSDTIPQNSQVPFLLYVQDKDKIQVQVLIQNETIWLTQRQMAELFQVGTPAINKHLRNIFEEEELIPSSTISILEIVQNEGAYDTKVL